jgi:5,10-methylene-tetrahydrofolate dehydrogenase/Methenyl tetrahydrofolate cyclohydrolase
LLLDGKKLSKEIKLQISEEVKILKGQGIVPGLAVVIVGNDPASKIYVRNKRRACEEIGVHSEEFALKEETTQEELLQLISNLNNDKKIHGILVQFPVSKHIDFLAVTRAILPEKDVDCFNEYNLGRICSGEADVFPCTPLGIIEILKRNSIKIEGKACTIVGRSNIVGKPLSLMMLNENATVTVCHSKSLNLKNFCCQADILISAVGKPKLISEDMVKKGATVIDVGINRLADGKLCGDVDFEKVKIKAEHITPVPGGVGPMTIAMLMSNLVKLAKNIINK